MVPQTTSRIASQPSIETASAGERLGAAMFAACLGAFLIFGAGFAHSSVLHNATHDVRHANAFPCH